MEQTSGRHRITRGKRITFVVTVVLGLISTVCLIGFFLALTDIWHEHGSPDFWRGEGTAAFEWRFLAVGYWPMLAFHVMFFVTIVSMIGGARRKPRGDG